jgi:hypothetical protein
MLRAGARRARTGARPVVASRPAGLLRLALLLMRNDTDKDKMASKEDMHKKVAHFQKATMKR